MSDEIPSLKDLDIHTIYDEIMRRHSMNWMKSDLIKVFELRDHLRAALEVVEKFCDTLQKEIK